MKYKLKSIIVIGAVAVLSFLTSCWLPAHRHIPVDASAWDYYSEATIVKLNLDGCSWVLQLKDGKKLEPVNLTDEFKKDNLNVLITYKSYKGNSVCMAGEMVTLTSIKLSK